MAGRTIGRNRSRWKTYTAALTVNPPAARATPHSTSNPIQSPHGNVVGQGGARRRAPAEAERIDVGPTEEDTDERARQKTGA